MSATTILLNWALSQYENMDCDEHPQVWMTAKSIRDFALDEADNWLTCEPGYESDGDEMFPAFVPLVSNIDIVYTIDWVRIAQAVLIMKKAQE
jgi:hypothetical protein